MSGIKKMIRIMSDKLEEQYFRGCIFLFSYQGKSIITSVALLFMFLILTTGEASANFSDEKYKQVCSKMLLLLASDFGSILSAAAGIGAIIASAAGGFKVAWSLIVVAIGSFTLGEYQEIWFQKC